MTEPRRVTKAGILLGLGLGGFFDGIVLHQILRWHYMVTSAGYPAHTVENLEINTLLDGIFHAATYVFVVAGVVVLFRGARSHLRENRSTRRFTGALLIGFGAFNLVEGAVNHQLLGLHHVNETVPRDQWVYWDIGFLAWGAAMLLADSCSASDRKRRGHAAARRPSRGPATSVVSTIRRSLEDVAALHGAALLPSGRSTSA